MIRATDLPVAGLPAMGSSTFSKAAYISVRTRVLVKMLLVLCHCVELFCLQVRSRDCVEYNT